MDLKVLGSAQERSESACYHFHIVDYIIFGAMLLLSTLTGLYYGCRSRYCKKIEAPTLRDYLTASGNMKPFPVAMSLVARYIFPDFTLHAVIIFYSKHFSYISGVTILGTPAEIYNFGTQYFFIAIAISVSGAIVALVYLPVFSKLQVFSSYEVSVMHAIAIRL